MPSVIPQVESRKGRVYGDRTPTLGGREEVSKKHIKADIMEVKQSWQNTSENLTNHSKKRNNNYNKRLQ